MSKNKRIDVDKNATKRITVEPTLEEQLARALSIALKEVVGNAKAKADNGAKPPTLSEDGKALKLKTINHDTNTVLGVLIDKHEHETGTKCVFSRPLRKTRSGDNSLKTRPYNIVVFRDGKGKYTVGYPKFTSQDPEIRLNRDVYDLDGLLTYLRGLPINSWYIGLLEDQERV